MQDVLWNLKKQCHKSTARISKVSAKDVWNSTPQAHCTSSIMEHWLIYSAEQSWCCLHNLKDTHYHCYQFLCCFFWAIIQHSFNLTPKREIKLCQVRLLQRPGNWSTPPNPMLGKCSIEAVVDVGHSMMVLPLTGATSVDESIIICPQVLQGGLVKIGGVCSHSTWVRADTVQSSGHWQYQPKHLLQTAAGIMWEEWHVDCLHHICGCFSC